MNSAMSRATCCLLALGLCAAAAGCAGMAQGDTVTILVPWDHGSAEYKAFGTVLNRFERRNSVQVVVESSRAPILQLDADRAAGDLPDLVDLPSPGSVYQLRNLLKPLNVDLLRSYDQPWRGLAELGTGRVYAVPVKADVKSLIWYNTRALRTPPKSWAALKNLSRHGTPWCLGLASGSASGWPGADWVAEILLSMDHAATYEHWLGGELQWSSLAVRTAWTTWGMLMRNGAAISGGSEGALETAFSKAAGKMASGQCELEHGALSATGLKLTARYGYVPFPSISGTPSPILVSGDFMGLFTKNQNARKLLAYLASPPAQTRWVNQPGYAFSADQAVAPAAYPAGEQQHIARLFQPAGRTLCFSADDMMLPDVSAAFEQAVLDYVNDRASLLSVLGGMQRTQRGAGSSLLAKDACANS